MTVLWCNDHIAGAGVKKKKKTLRLITEPHSHLINGSSLYHNGKPRQSVTDTNTSV